MALTQDQKNRISEVIKKILSSRIKSFPDLNSQIRNAPFHEAVLDSFKTKLKDLNIEAPRLIAIASWLHGLSTSLGSGFESIAHILSGGYKRSFTRSYTLTLKNDQAQSIEKIIRELKAGEKLPSLKRENKEIFNIKKTDRDIKALGFTADVFIEKEKEVVAIELKSVRPNSGEGRGEKQKILNGKAALKYLYPNKEIKFFIGFPFDPTSTKPIGYDKDRFFNYLVEFKKFFDKDEVLIANELWDYLSGQKNTMDQILDVIKETVKIIKKD